MEKKNTFCIERQLTSYSLKKKQYNNDQYNKKRLSRYKRTQRINLKSAFLMKRDMFYFPLQMPVIKAQSWLVYDIDNQMQIGSKKGYCTMQIASLTKMMTAIVCMQIILQVNLQQHLQKIRVTASNYPCSLPGTSANILPQHRYTIKSLLFGLLLPSGNDAAQLLCQYFGRIIYKQNKYGKVKTPESINMHEQEKYGLTKLYRKQFITKMNQIAKRLLMSHTVFINPHGLTDHRNRSTARDLNKLCNKFITYQFLLSIVQQKSYYFSYCNINGKTFIGSFRNTNNLLNENCKGIKTGITPTAGSCLASLWNFQQKNKNLIIIVLGCKQQEDRFNQTKKLLKFYL